VTNTSTYATIPGSTPQAWILWGDNSNNTISHVYGSTASHTYSTPGTYIISLYSILHDSTNNVQLCFTHVQDTVIVTPPPPPNVIEGFISWDTAATNASLTSFRVYLIQHDASANTLTAVDSQVVSGYMPFYSFSGHPAGSYRTKAAVMAGSPAYSYLVPTYHDSSLYWSNAQVINHTGAMSVANHIWMKNGVNTGGPGFIGGNISAGANKGTGVGIPGIMVALLTPSGQTLKYTYTDVNGDYSFNNLPAGSYTVFPEALNYITIEATNVQVTLAQPSITALDFKQTPTHIKLIPSGISDLPKADLFSLFPNPANSTVAIRFADGHSGKVVISLTDVTGRQVMVKESDARSTEQLSVSQLQSGIYFITVATDKATHTQKIVLKH
jgi:hypothetical protein